MRHHWWLVNIASGSCLLPSPANVDPDPPAISVEKGFFSSKTREKGVFFKLGYGRGIRFGREWRDPHLCRHMTSLGHSKSEHLFEWSQKTLLHLTLWYLLALLVFTKRLITYTQAHNEVSHWGRVTHICVSKLTIIGSDNGLSPGRRQAIIWTNDGILLIGLLGTNFSEIVSEIQSFSFKKMNFKMSFAK